MATYSAITSGQIDAESPLDVTLAGQWTNNLLAVIEGAAGAPQIVDAALVWPGAWAKIDSWVPTAVNSKDFTWDETLYSDIAVQLSDIAVATDGEDIYAILGHTNGTVFSTGNYIVTYSSIETAPTLSGNQSTSGFNLNTSLANGNIGNAAGEGFGGIFILSGLDAGTSEKMCRFVSTGENTGGTTFGYAGWGRLNNDLRANTVDTVRLILGIGNFQATGLVTVWGLKR